MTPALSSPVAVAVAAAALLTAAAFARYMYSLHRPIVGGASSPLHTVVALIILRGDGGARAGSCCSRQQAVTPYIVYPAVATALLLLCPAWRLSVRMAGASAKHDANADKVTCK